MSQVHEIDDFPDPPADVWAWELFEDALFRLACARMAYDEVRAENQPLERLAEARFELDRIRDDIAILRGLVLTRPR